ncbi:hypothetical protein [Streptomyces sannanensis]|uniref:hypothetical protein n=1 Tax=Streptomyces sannanensis TaxID=285536 RepID=UPI0031F18CA8
MKKFTEVIGFILLVQGVISLVHAWTGWFGYGVVVRYLRFLDGYEVYTSIVLAVVGLAVLIAADRGHHA